MSACSATVPGPRTPALPELTAGPGSRPRPLALLAALTAFAFGTLLVAADYPWLGTDGGAALATSRLPVPEMLDIWARDTHPPLYYLLLHYWMDLAGTGGFVVKFPGLAAAVAAIPLIYHWGRGAGGRAVGLLAALLLATSIDHVMWGVAVRDYALGVALSIAALYTFARALSTGAWRQWGLHALVTGGALYTYYLAAPVVAAQGVYLLLTRHRRWLGRWAAGMGAVALAYVPWLWLAGHPAWLKLQGGAAPWAGAVLAFPLDPEHGLVLLALRWLTSSEAAGLAPWAAGLLVAACAGAALAHRSRVPLAHGPLLLLGLFTAFGASYGAARFWLEFEGSVERFIYATVPFYSPLVAVCLLAIARGLAWRWGQSRQVAGRPVGHTSSLVLAGLLLLVGVFFLRSYVRVLSPSNPPPPYRALQAHLEENTTSDDLLLFISPEGAGEFLAVTRERWRWRMIPLTYFRTPVVVDVEERAAAILGERGTRAIWFLSWDDSDRDASILDYLASRAFPSPTAWVEKVFVAPFVPPAPLAFETSGAGYAGGIELVEAAYDREASPGGAIRVLLAWRGANPTDVDYRIFVHLVGPREGTEFRVPSSEDGEETRNLKPETGEGYGGRLWAQHLGCPGCGQRPTTGWRPGERVEDRHGLLLPTDIPAGSYWLEIGFSGGGRRLELQEGGNAVRLGPLSILPAP